MQEEEIEAAKVQVAADRKAAAENLATKQAPRGPGRAAERRSTTMVALRADAEQAAQARRPPTSPSCAAAAGAQPDRGRAEEARRRGAQAAIAAARRAGRSVPAYGGPISSGGFLDYPVHGPVTSPFGWRTHPIYGYRSLHDGIDFGAACGTPIRAAASGTRDASATSRPPGATG